MNERIIAYLWYALEVLMEFGLLLRRDLSRGFSAKSYEF